MWTAHPHRTQGAVGATHGPENELGAGARDMRTRIKKTLGLGTTAMVIALSVSACKEDGDDADGDCLSNEEYFQENVYAPILADNCETCHNAAGAAKNTSFILRAPESGPDFIEQNMEMFQQLSKLEYEGRPWILLKPTMQIEHEGGERFKTDSEEYNAFVDMIDRLENPVACADDGDNVEEFFDGVELLDERATLRKATLALAGRLPTIDEENLVQAQSWEGVDLVLDAVMQEDTFYDRIREVYNDKFLTDRYYNGTDAIDLLDGEDYPSAYFFDGLPDGERENVAGAANRGLAREPIELIIHTLRNGLPYTEVLTADYTMVNWASAQTLGVQANFTTERNDGEFVAAKVPGIPHAGVLTTVTFLNRFPTTDTNRNRHRSRMLHELFLATDVQALGNRPVDATAITGHNPTMNDPNCTICHEVIDPAAGAFQNWDDMGRFRPPELGWFPDMLPAGFGTEQMPSDQALTGALAWTVREVVQDPRFALAPVHIMFEGLSGQKPLKEPDDPTAEDYLGAITAAQVQREEFDRIGQAFIDSNYDLKVVVKEIVKSNYYRAYNFSDEGLEEEVVKQRRFELAETGMGRLLTPENLNRKIAATTGYPWRGGFDGADYLIDDDNYMIFYGGIDSQDVTTRITAPNGVMANVAKRMGNEMSCLSVPQDFARPASERVLFPLVEPTHEPEDANGFEIPGSAAQIRSNIQFLVQRLWGEYLEIDHAEIDRIYQLYLDVWKEGQAGMALPEDQGGYSTQVPGQCQARSDYFTQEEYPEERVVADDSAYTIRAWMAVTTYMLSDFRYLHE